MNNDLAKRAVACKGFRWMPGMLDLWNNIRIQEVGTSNNGTEQWIIGHGSGVVVDRPVHSGDAPALGDPATRGCLLELVRLAWGTTTLCTDWDGFSWSVVRCSGAVLAWGATEAEALVAALEACNV